MPYVQIAYMKKSTILVIIGICAVALLIWSILKINTCDSSTGDCSHEGTKEVSEAHTLPEGYTLDSYTVEKVTEVSCSQDSECETPMEYLVQSRCPFTSLCIDNKCTVVCPHVKTVEIQGEITSVKPEMDGSILTVTDGETSYEVLVSIPNLGEGYVSSIERIEVGRYIQVIGSVLRMQDTERIIASHIYVEGAITGEHPCNLEPDPGFCKAAMPRYYFDKEEGKCKEFIWGGCGGTVPFDSLDVCKGTCEGLPEKPLLTKELCVTDGGRVAKPPCGEDEINIGQIEDLACCMSSGGSATSK